MTIALTKEVLKKNIKDIACCFLIVLLVLGICTKSSPLYPINDWDDSNGFLTAARMLKNGKIIYKDLFEHKGPLLHFIHVVAVTISANSFFGVFILELIAGTIFIYICYKILELYKINNKWLFLIIVTAFTYSAVSFRFWRFS